MAITMVAALASIESNHPMMSSHMKSSGLIYLSRRIRTATAIKALAISTWLMVWMMNMAADRSITSSV